MNPQPAQLWKCVNILQGHSAAINSVALSADGQILASASDDKTVKLWNLKTGQPLYTFFGHSKEVYSVAISPDSQMLVAGDFNKKITSWNLPKRGLLRSFY
ncbi:MAG TPA: serine/threonine protein kinase, partial [Phormidium sp.]